MQSAASKNELDTIVKENDKVVVDMWAPWCPPCRAFSPMFEASAQNNKDGVVYVKVNIQDASDVATALDVRSIPTILYFKNGKEVGRNSGLPESVEVFDEGLKERLE